MPWLYWAFDLRENYCPNRTETAENAGNTALYQFLADCALDLIDAHLNASIKNPDVVSKFEPETDRHETMTLRVNRTVELKREIKSLSFLGIAFYLTEKHVRKEMQDTRNKAKKQERSRKELNLSDLKRMPTAVLGVKDGRPVMLSAGCDARSGSTYNFVHMIPPLCDQSPYQAAMPSVQALLGLAKIALREGCLSHKLGENVGFVNLETYFTDQEQGVRKVARLHTKSPLSLAFHDHINRANASGYGLIRQALENKTSNLSRIFQSVPVPLKINADPVYAAARAAVESVNRTIQESASPASHYQPDATCMREFRGKLGHVFALFDTLNHRPDSRLRKMEDEGVKWLIHVENAGEEPKKLLDIVTKVNLGC